MWPLWMENNITNDNITNGFPHRTEVDIRSSRMETRGVSLDIEYAFDAIPHSPLSMPFHILINWKN
jgi:hypothetical protein